MSLTVIFWAISLTTLLVILIYAKQRKVVVDVAFEEVPTGLGDFIAIELTRMMSHVSRLLTHARPHGERAVFHGTAFLKKGQDKLFERVFGRIEVEKGKAASFFLKRIAEHQETLRQKGKKGAEKL